MKVNWFHLMPYRFLPASFENDYHSVWVDIPTSLFEPVCGHHLYNEFLDELEFADKMGFDGICVNEHHANAYGMMPSPNLMAAAIARRTSNANLIVLGNGIAMYNPPPRVAEEYYYGARRSALYLRCMRMLSSDCWPGRLQYRCSNLPPQVIHCSRNSD
jgi:Luciferase-like monooxygenase